MPLLWVFKRDPALNNAQGFIDVPDVLADKLVQAGKAATQYDQSLMCEPEQPGDGQDAPQRAVPPADVPAAPMDAPAEGAPQAPAQTDDDMPPRRARKL